MQKVEVKKEKMYDVRRRQSACAALIVTQSTMNREPLHVKPVQQTEEAFR